MHTPNLLTKLICVAVVLVLLVDRSYSQITTPTATLADSDSYVAVNPKGQHDAIHVEFDVKFDDVVAGMLISYRVNSNGEYKPLQLKRGLNLRYEGDLPYSKRIEYYLTLSPEKGTSFDLLGSATNPRVIAASDLPSRERERTHIGKKGIAIIIGIVLAIVGIGAVKMARSK